VTWNTVPALENSMRTTSLLVPLLLSLAAAFLALNGSVVMAPAHLSLYFATLEAPIGLVMLAVLAAVVFAFVSDLAIGQSTSLPASRRHAKELEAQRDLADQAEASRFTALRALMLAELERLASRVSQAQDALRTEIRDNANAIAATIADHRAVDRKDGRESRQPAVTLCAARADAVTPRNICQPYLCQCSCTMPHNTQCPPIL
jgi:uncharacterized integral membrane protein